MIITGEALSEPETRQANATAAAEPATVFIGSDLRTARIHSRKSERRFIGHGLISAAAALRSLGEAPQSFLVPAGEVRLWRDEDGVEWLHASEEWTPSANARHRQVDGAAAVEVLPGPPPDEPVQVWAWIDETSGLARARQFKPSEGIAEDEACGSASMVLARKLGRELAILHGRGSRIRVRPRANGVDLGGRCAVE